MDDQMEKLTRDMLIAVRAEKGAAQERVRELEEREKILEGWLRNGTPAQTELPVIPLRGKHAVIEALTLRDFLSRRVQDGQPRTNQELAELAREAGLVFEDARSINAVMLGFQRADMVDRKDDKWIRRKD